MAAPYCTLTGTIPGGENGRAIVRIIPDVKGATATVDGAAVSIREIVVRTDQAGAVNVEVLAPGAGVSPAGSWTHTIYVDSPECDLVKHVVLAQGETIDIMTADPTSEVSPLPFGGGGGLPGPQGPPGPAGERGPAGQDAVTPQLDEYLKKEDAANTYIQSGVYYAEIARKADATDLSSYLKIEDADKKYGEKADVEDALRQTNPFKNGARYYSPVTYYWPDYYQDGKPGQFSKWAQTLKFRDNLGYVILNRNSGDWEPQEVDFQKQGELALGAGAKKLLFYIKTQYGAAINPDSEDNRGIPNAAKFTKEYILEQLKRAKHWYGDLVQGVFLDEVINGWDARKDRLPWYKDLIDTIRRENGLDFVIAINTGSNISQEVCNLDFDVCMMFEGTATKFLEEDPTSPILPDHMKAYPSTRWWAVVHSVTSENYQKVFDKADNLAISHLYVTDGFLVEDPQNGGQWHPVGNPYENPPGAEIRELIIPWLKGYLKLKLKVDNLKIPEIPKMIVLGPDDPVPAGTPSGTVIVRRAK